MDYSFIFKENHRKSSYMTHEQYFTLDATTKSNKLRPIRKMYHQKQLKVFCSCKKPNPPMKMAYITKAETYYFSSINKDHHSEDCYYRREEGEFRSSTSVYGKGFVEKNGKFEIKFDSQDFQIESELTKQKKGKSKGTGSPSNSQKGVSTYKPSVYAATLRMVTEAWNSIIHNHHYEKKEYPKNDVTTVYEHLINKTAYKYLHENINLTKILYKGEKEGRLVYIERDYKEKTAAFAILLLKNDGIQKNIDTYRLSLMNPRIAEPRYFDVSTVLFENAIKAIRNINGPYIVGGFVETTGFQETPRFISIGLVPINDYGAPIESSYERTLYTHLCEQERAVVRHDLSKHPAWEKLHPDGLLLDTSPRTILEVFGMSENMESYHIQRIIKVAHFSSLQPKYNFWFWDAFAKVDFKDLPIKYLPPETK